MASTTGGEKTVGESMYILNSDLTDFKYEHARTEAVKKIDGTKIKVGFRVGLPFGYKIDQGFTREGFATCEPV